MTREQELKLIYRHTHRDFKGRIGGCGAILILRAGGTTLVMMTALTDAEIADKLPSALRKEQERIERRDVAEELAGIRSLAHLI